MYLSSIKYFRESLPVFSIEFDCLQSDLEETINKVALFIGKVYAVFPSLDNFERKILKIKNVWLQDIDSNPTPNVCKKFEEALTREIINVLIEQKENNLKLLTDYYPEGILCKIVESIFKDKQTLPFLFPYKTYTKIRINEERTKLYLEMNFKTYF